MRLFFLNKYKGRNIEKRMLRYVPRAGMRFFLTGWVLMPDHFHLLVKPEPAASTSRIMQELKKRTAQQILSALSGNQQLPWCEKMLASLRQASPLQKATRPLLGLGVQAPD